MTVVSLLHSDVAAMEMTYLAIRANANCEGCGCFPGIAPIPEVLDWDWQLTLPARKSVCVLYIPV